MQAPVPEGSLGGWKGPAFAADGVDELLSCFVPLRASALRAEVEQTIEKVKKDQGWSQKLDIKVDLLAWPFGIYDPELMAAAKAAGYVAAFSIDRRPVTRAENVMSLPRSIVTDADRGARFEALLAPPKTTPTPSTPVKATTSK